jgi:hypothetical protein
LQQYEQEQQMRYVTTIEQMAKEEIALTMLGDRVPVETVARYTGLSIEKVQELAAQSQS